MNLHVFETDDEGFYVAPEGYKISWVDIEYLIEAKRLTGPELAAEYWYTDLMYERAKWAESRDTAVLDGRSYILYRFATNPHYDELDD